MWGLLGTLATSVLGGIFQHKAATQAADTASAAQLAASQMAIAEQRRQFDALLKRSQPYIDAGKMGMNGVLDLAGLNGSKAQGAAISGIQASPGFQAQLQQGENAILSNASATGGLRGGNTQAALGQFAPQMLQQAIDAQYYRLGGLTTLGQNTAMNVGSQGMNMANAIGNQYTQGGAAQAGAALARGQATANMWGGIAGAAGEFFGGMPLGKSLGGMFSGGQKGL